MTLARRLEQTLKETVLKGVCILAQGSPSKGQTTIPEMEAGVKLISIIDNIIAELDSDIQPKQKAKHYLGLAANALAAGRNGLSEQTPIPMLSYRRRTMNGEYTC